MIIWGLAHAPERKASSASDGFMAGVTAFELLTGMSCTLWGTYVRIDEVLKPSGGKSWSVVVRLAVLLERTSGRNYRG